MAHLQNEPRLGRCILTPKPPKRKPIAIPTGNWWGLESEPANGTSATPNARPSYVAPTAKMAPSQAHIDKPGVLSYSGKGKARATSSLPEQTSAPKPVNDSEPSSNERPLLESDLLSDSQRQALEAERRYQAQVDRVERRRDREDANFDPASTSQTQNGDENSRKKPRRAVEHRATDVPSNQGSALRQKQAQQPVAQQTSIRRQQQVQSVPKKRKADVDVPLENVQQPPSDARTTSSRRPIDTSTNHEPEQKRYASDRHHNKRFNLLKPESQLKRKQYLKTITKRWKITSDQLMTFPYAPRRATEPGQPIMQPLDWNSGLLEAVAQLTLTTRGDFAKACKFAKDAFDRSSPKGTKQLTAKVLFGAIAEQENGSSSRNLQDSNGVQGSGFGHDATPYQAAGATGTRRDARSKTIDEQPPSPSVRTVRSSATTGQAPPSPAASPVAAPASPQADAIKSEPVDPVAQQDNSIDFGSQSSGTEERLTLQSKERILSYQLAIVREQLEMNERQKREKDRIAARIKQLGGSPSQPLVL